MVGDGKIGHEHQYPIPTWGPGFRNLISGSSISLLRKSNFVRAELLPEPAVSGSSFMSTKDLEREKEIEPCKAVRNAYDHGF